MEPFVIAPDVVFACICNGFFAFAAMWPFDGADIAPALMEPDDIAPEFMGTLDVEPDWLPDMEPDDMEPVDAGAPVWVCENAAVAAAAQRMMASQAFLA
jgi:hypothetical protein